MNSKVGSLEEKVKLPPTETISRCYQPQGNRKVIRILTVAVYVLCVSLAAIMLSLYYIFIWDPSIRPFATKPNNCDKVVIPEKIAIRLLNTSEVTAEQFYKSILEQYRILNHMQQQRQQFLQKQHLQLQQLSNTNRFQEVFATATIIQANRNNDPFNNNRKTTPIRNGTLLLETRPATSSFTVDEQQLLLQQEPQHMAPILDTTTTHIKRKPHRKHFNHHRHNVKKSYRKSQNTNTNPNIDNNNNPDVTEQQQQRFIENTEIIEHATSVMEPISYTPMPIPLILNTREEKRPHHHERSAKMSALQTRRRTSASAGVPIYERPTYMNPFLTGELIFEK